MPSPWGQAIGGISEFLKLQRGLSQNTEDRERDKAEFESGQKLREVQTKSGELGNTETQRRIDRQPELDRQADFDRFGRNFGWENVTEEQIQAYTGGDPKRAGEAEAIRRGVAAQKARQATEDKLKATQQEGAQLGVDTARAQLPGIQAKAASVKEAWDWLEANPNADPRTNFMAYQMNERVGNKVSLTPYEQQQFALRLAAANRPDYGAAARVQHAVQEEMQAKSLPPGVDVRAQNVLEPMLLTLAQNAKTGMNQLALLERDITAPERQGLGVSQGGGASYNHQQLNQERQRVSAALYKEADDIRVQMRKAGYTTPEVEQWVTSRLRQALSLVPKYYNGQLVGGPPGATPVASPGGGGRPQLSGQ